MSNGTVRNPITTLPEGEAERPWYRRVTLVAGGLLILSQYLEAQGLIPAGISSQLETASEQGMALLETVLGLGVLAGVYRQIAK
jgi:hypothetical protein